MKICQTWENKNCRDGEVWGGKRRESVFYCVPDFNIWQSVVYHHGPLMVREGEGGESRGREYQYEFFIWWVLWEIAFQKAGRVKVHGRVRGEREWEVLSYKGQVGNNGVPTHEEHTLVCDIRYTYYISKCTSIKSCKSKTQKAENV